MNYLCADLITVEGRAAVVHALSAYPYVEGFVHNAGVIDPILPMTMLDDDAWRSVMATNLDVPFFLTKALREKLIGGRVLHIGSGAAYLPIVGWAPYCVSKAALAMLVKCWQLECPDIAFAHVLPGIIDTDMQAKIRASQHMTSEKHAFFQNLKDTHQLLSVKQVAVFLTWLLLDVEAAVFSAQEWDIYDPCHERFIYA